MQFDLVYQRISNHEYNQKQMSKRGKVSRKKKSTQLQTGTEPGDQRQEGYQMMSNSLRIAQAKRILSGELMPTNFRFRQKEIQIIQAKIKEFLGKEKTNTPKIVMITGSPGAGKTLSTNFILKKCAYKVIALNSNVVKKKKDVQRILAEEILGENLDDKQLTTFKVISSLEKKKNIPPFELFFNSTKQFLSEDFFSLFTHKNLKIMLIGISNTIDALQKYGPKLNIRPSDVTNIVFNPYTIDEIKSIIQQKIECVQKRTGIKLNMNEKLIKYSVNKINEMKKGDMRMVFEFMRAISRHVFPKIQNLNDQLQDEIDINIKTVQQSFQQIKVQKAKLINQIPFQQQAILIAFYTYISQYDMIFLTEDQIKKKAKEIYQKIHLDPKKDISQELSQLEMYGFVEHKKRIVIDGRQGSNPKRYILKIPLEDIRYSFEGHEILGRFFTQPNQ